MHIRNQGTTRDESLSRCGSGRTLWLWAAVGICLATAVSNSSAQFPLVTSDPYSVVQPAFAEVPNGALPGAVRPVCASCAVTGANGCSKCVQAGQMATTAAGFGCPDCGTECRCRPKRSKSCAHKIISGVDSANCLICGEQTWKDRGPLPWEVFAHGEYIGPHRTQHVGQYRLRVQDVLNVVYRLTRERSAQPYELTPGDVIRVESIADEKLDRQLEVQPDGTVTLPLVGTVVVAGRTTDQIRDGFEKRYKKFFQEPAITVTPIKVNTRLDDLRASVDARQGVGGQSQLATVSPDGTIQLPGIGVVPAQGLTLEELKREIDARYAALVDGIEVTPLLSKRAPRFIYVVGEVTQPGRFDLVGPTTVTQAIALAQGWNNGANLRNIVVFRRAEDWRLMATKIDIRGALYGRRPIPSDEIWLRDSDVVIVPKQPVKVLNDAIELIFTNGVYSIAPFLSDPVFFSDATTL